MASAVFFLDLKGKVGYLGDTLSGHSADEVYRPF